MLIHRKIISIMLMLLVFTSQAVAADGINSCDMDMHQMGLEHSGMAQGDMDCCNDDANCAMDCSLSMVSMLNSISPFEAEHVSSEKITSLQNSTAIRSLASLFRPPISA